MFRFFRRPTTPGWLRDREGEVYRVRIELTPEDHFVIHTSIGKRLEGYIDGTTSREQFEEWWPAKPIPRLSQLRIQRMTAP